MESSGINNGNTDCRICGRAKASATNAGTTGSGSQQGIVSRMTCPYCGEYRILGLIEGGYPTIEPGSRFALSRAAISKNMEPRKEDGRVQTIFLDSTETAARLALDFPAPADAVEQLDLMLETFARSAPNLTEETPEDISALTWTALIGLPDQNTFRGICALAEEAGLLAASNTSQETWSLTLAGWDRVRKLREKPRSKDDAFVAMWFHPKMDSLWQHGFHPALSELGWKPVRIDREHFLGRVDDEIMKRIRRAGVLVADITGARPGVYFEAGFALGLGIPVIWTCNENWRTQLQIEVFPDEVTPPRMEERTWFEMAHFDTKTFPHILWKDAEDLKLKLSARIEGLGLSPGRGPIA